LLTILIILEVVKELAVTRSAANRLLASGRVDWHHTLLLIKKLFLGNLSSHAPDFLFPILEVLVNSAEPVGNLGSLFLFISFLNALLQVLLNTTKCQVFTLATVEVNATINLLYLCVY
jgi:hypothetical protein